MIDGNERGTFEAPSPHQDPGNLPMKLDTADLDRRGHPASGTDARFRPASCGLEY